MIEGAKDANTAVRCTAAGFSTEGEGAWLVLADGEASTESLARQLFQTLATTTVWWSIHTVVDQVWILCFEDGQEVREVRYSSDEGWATNSGQPRPFESPRLRQWLAKKRLAASPDGYDILDCFIGADGSTPEPASVAEEPTADAPVLAGPPQARADEPRHLQPMQAVGRSCDRCGKRIGLLLEGDGCVACDKVFHFDCLPTPEASGAASSDFDLARTKSRRASPNDLCQWLDEVLVRLAVPLGSAAEALCEVFEAPG